MIEVVEAGVGLGGELDPDVAAIRAQAFKSELGLFLGGLEGWSRAWHHRFPGANNAKRQGLIRPRGIPYHRPLRSNLVLAGTDKRA